ncbi:MAG: high frequency lysogenization protein HflD, partial [Nitrososphaera sp.]
MALAGMFQAVRLVQEVAYTGRMVDTNAFEASIKSLLKTDAATTDEVYGIIPGDLQLGLKTLREQLHGGKKQAKDLELMRYVIGLIILEKKLLSNRRVLEKIGIVIDRTQRQAEHLSATHSDVIANLADLYANTISTLTPRILVDGEAIYLRNPDNVACIRALLLAGIRSAVLWRQKGGSRWQI